MEPTPVSQPPQQHHQAPSTNITSKRPAPSNPVNAIHVPPNENGLDYRGHHPMNSNQMQSAPPSSASQSSNIRFSRWSILNSCCTIQTFLIVDILRPFWKPALRLKWWTSMAQTQINLLIRINSKRTLNFNKCISKRRTWTQCVVDRETRFSRSKLPAVIRPCIKPKINRIWTVVDSENKTKRGCK